jgi:hypothetical protein
MIIECLKWITKQNDFEKSKEILLVLLIRILV